MTLALSAPKVQVGQSTTLKWSTTNATSCTGADSLSGTQPTSGSISITPSAGGKYIYTLNCTGAQGVVTQSVVLTVPMPVLASSYDNKMAAGDPTGGAGVPFTTVGFLSPATAYADFFQAGEYAMVSHTIEYNATDPSTAGKVGHIAFYAKNASGTWVDKTATVLDNTAGCLHPRKAVVADFNGDGVPDVFFACHGFDAAPFPGEQPHVLLSQPDGKYKNISLPITCYCHGATAADLNGDGKPDLIVTDTSVASIPFALINNGDGTAFTQDFSRIPSSMRGMGGIYSVELIDTGSGSRDLFVGSGTPPGSDPANPSASWALANGILVNDGNGTFLNTPLRALPNPAGSTGIVYGLALDFVVSNGYVYYQQINNNWDAANPTYADIVVHKARLSDLTGSTLYEHFGAYNNGTTWFPWMSLGEGSTVKAQCDQYVYDSATLPGSSCGVSIGM